MNGCGALEHTAAKRAAEAPPGARAAQVQNAPKEPGNADSCTGYRSLMFSKFAFSVFKVLQFFFFTGPG